MYVCPIFCVYYFDLALYNCVKLVCKMVPCYKIFIFISYLYFFFCMRCIHLCTLKCYIYTLYVLHNWVDLIVS